jgi:hypothetical protein
MGISDRDFSDLVNKLATFRNSLNDAQKSLFDNALPTAQDVAQGFGPDCSLSDIQSLLGTAPATQGITCVGWVSRK